MTSRARWLLQDGLVEAARRAPGRTALVDEERELTYGELADHAFRLACGLRELGIRRGDRVAIQMENSWRAVVSIYGALLAGGVFVLLNPQTKTDKLGHVLADSDASVLITDADLPPNAAIVERDLASLRAVVSAGRPRHLATEVVVAWDELAERSDATVLANETIPLDLASLVYTSGSTGEPKGVMMTHQSMVFVTQSVTSYLRLDGDDRILNVLPLSFDYGLYQLLIAVDLGATVVFERSFAFPAKTVKRAAELEVTVFPGVPTIFARLLSQASASMFTLPSVRRVTNTGAAMPPEFLPGLRKIFPHALFFLMYGLTECKRVSYLEPELVETKPRSVGKAIPGSEALVLAPDGRPAAPGQVGILHVRGPHVMAGYWRKPELTAHMLREGPIPGERMLCTHDQFTVDEEGFLYFVGRTDDIIKTAGQKVSPAEVEQALYAVPGVREAAVVGVPDPVLGEAVYAYVASDGSEVTESAVKRACRERLEGFMVPARVIVRDALPKTGSGKIEKQSLRETDADIA